MIDPADLAPHVPRPLLSAAARICGHPLVNLDSMAVSGPESWADVIQRATAQDRLDLLTLLEPHLLVAFARGQERLDEDESVDDCADVEPCVVGDAGALDLLRQALALMPPAVSSMVCREAAFIAVGRESAAWTARGRFAGTDDRERHRIVAVGPAADVRVLMHESVHLWFAPRPNAKATAATVQGEAGIRALAASQPEVWDGILAGRDDEEIVADALALVWLYRRPSGLPS